MTFYQELQLSSTGSKQLIRNTTDPKEKRRHILIYNFKVYLVMAFCVAVVSIYSKLTGNNNSVVGVTVLLAVLVLRQAGRNVILEIEIQGAMKVKKKIPEALLVFVTPPTVEELERRLRDRGTETAQVIADRLARAGEEAKGMDQYDYILVNDTVEECVDHLHQIIVSEHSRASRNTEFIADIQQQTRAFQK